MPIDAGIRARRFLPPSCTGVVTEEAADPDRALSDAKKVRASPSVWSVRKSPLGHTYDAHGEPWAVPIE